LPPDLAGALEAEVAVFMPAEEPLAEDAVFFPAPVSVRVRFSVSAILYLLIMWSTVNLFLGGLPLKTPTGIFLQKVP
jgi:hypothetical protein